MTGSAPRHGAPGSGEPGAPGGRTYKVTAESVAPVAVVWPLLAEARRWSEWSFLTATGLERDGTPEPDGVGAVRRFARFGIGSREEVVAWDPPTHLAYRILTGFPVRNYRSDITLEPQAGGTRIEWTGSFDPKWPGTGRLLSAFLPVMMQRFATSVARYADEQVS
ncbi:MAG: SRPBCC family protein [Acidimicrobiales bacterium]